MLSALYLSYPFQCFPCFLFTFFLFVFWDTEGFRPMEGTFHQTSTSTAFTRRKASPQPLHEGMVNTHIIRHNYTTKLARVTYKVVIRLKIPAGS